MRLNGRRHWMGSPILGIHRLLFGFIEPCIDPFRGISKMTSMISSISRPIPKFQYTLYLIVNLRYYEATVAALRGTNSGPDRSGTVRSGPERSPERGPDRPARSGTFRTGTKARNLPRETSNQQQAGRAGRSSMAV